MSVTDSTAVEKNAHFWHFTQRRLIHVIAATSSFLQQRDSRTASRRHSTAHVAAANYGTCAMGCRRDVIVWCWRHAHVNLGSSGLDWRLLFVNLQAVPPQLHQLQFAVDKTVVMRRCTIDALIFKQWRLLLTLACIHRTSLQICDLAVDGGLCYIGPLVAVARLSTANYRVKTSCILQRCRRIIAGNELCMLSDTAVNYTHTHTPILPTMSNFIHQLYTAISLALNMIFMLAIAVSQYQKRNYWVTTVY